MFTLWAEGKVLLGEIEVNPGPEKKDYNTVMCHGIWFTDSMGNSADFTQVKNKITDDGPPIHTIENTILHIKTTRNS